jgi:hypothetical protein
MEKRDAWVFRGPSPVNRWWREIKRRTVTAEYGTARSQQRLELYRDGKLPADDAKIKKIAQGQAQYLAAARNINDAILAPRGPPQERDRACASGSARPAWVHLG